jgi:hypothetical protein
MYLFGAFFECIGTLHQSQAINAPPMCKQWIPKDKLERPPFFFQQYWSKS